MWHGRADRGRHSGISLLALHDPRREMCCRSISSGCKHWGPMLPKLGPPSIPFPKGALPRIVISFDCIARMYSGTHGERADDVGCGLGADVKALIELG